MAPLPKICRDASALRSMLLEGRAEDARRLATTLLQAGKASSAAQIVIAEILNPPPRGRGRPSSAHPKRWLEIGEAFDRLRDEGRTYESTVEELAVSFGSNIRTVETTIAFYRAALD